jgi:hypothetical protein
MLRSGLVLSHTGVYLSDRHIFFIVELVFTVYVLLILFLKFDLLWRINRLV